MLFGLGAAWILDRPACSGRCLTRGADAFRLGRFGINVLSGRSYEPGTESLVTSWKTPSWWVSVRDARTSGSTARVRHHPFCVRSGTALGR
jgi:hypothetical protein